MGSEPSPSPSDVAPEQVASISRIVAGAILFVTVGYAVATLVLVRVGVFPLANQERPESTNFVLGMALSVIGVCTAAASFFVRKIMEDRLRQKEVSSSLDRQGIVIVTMALSELPGAIGFVYALLLGTLGVPFILFACAVGACIFHFPTKAMFTNVERE